ncbi:MAG: cytidine deaminase [Blastocatellia bacterium]|nr:cytidine deaminase [Blastocatellia bacterium]
MGRTEQELIDAATGVRERAYAPFSGFKVGAAVETESGVVVGCNVESASYGLTMCAERAAIFAAVAQGMQRISRVAVVADSEKLTAPCGACRQVIWEFGGDIPVILSNLEGMTETVRMSELLPRAFDAEYLK